ncbi:Sterol uptake control protein [Paramyrothecium foliicola]|nr:Sterol uptake control protein [Paramyrothecium foliicola]
MSDDSSSDGAQHVSPGTTKISQHAVSALSIRRKQPRKGHTKSRRGCLNCKRRRVKCQETLPECDHCKRLGLACQYPSDARRTPPPSAALHSTPTQFSMEDLRFFHHFLLFAYPGLPLGGHSVWQEVAKLSHSYDFLMHAMLGLAASHLTTCQGGNHSIKALSHRVKSVRSLTAPPRSLEEDAQVARPSTRASIMAEKDARFATSMALAFQSSYMSDGMDEFLWMIRGCVLTMGSGMKLEESIFHTFSTEAHTQTVFAMNQGRLVAHDERQIEVKAALKSVRRLGPLCQSTIQVGHLAALERILRAAETSYAECEFPQCFIIFVLLTDIAFNEVSAFYDVIGDLTAEEFRSFMDPSNCFARIELAHFFTIEYLIAEVALNAVMNSFAFRQRVIGDWILGIARDLPPDYRSYVNWPLEYATRAQAAANSKLQQLE